MHSFEFYLNSTDRFFWGKVRPMSQLDATLVNFVDEAGRLNILGGMHSIWVPPLVTLRVKGGGRVLADLQLPSDISPPYLVYPVSNMVDAIDDHAMMEVLKTQGWRRVLRNEYRDVDVLNEFVRLARADIFSDKGIESVCAFAKKRGPLWRCCTPGHDLWCHWLPIRAEKQYQYKNLCIWYAAEEAAAFVERARLVKNVLNAVVTLREGKSLPVGLWEQILPFPLLEDYSSERLQWYDLLSAVEFHAGIGREPRLVLDYVKGVKLDIVTELGFIHAVWFAVLQLVSNATALYQCHGCWSFYVRTQRRPKEGQSNYCEQCGPTAGKREWARKNRTRR